MENIRIEKVVKELKLEREIVGIHFLVYENDYNKCDAEPTSKINRLCGHVNKANHGMKIKVRLENFSCGGGPNQTGIRPTPECYISGQIMKYTELYQDLAIGRSVCDSYKRIPQKIYGLEIGPLKEMSDADVVIIIAMAEQIMRIMEGYAYHFGTPKPFTSVGNGAMCGDLTSNPFMKNDINLSVMCCGARTSTVSSSGELGVGMPSHIFKYIADGIINISEKI